MKRCFMNGSGDQRPKRSGRRYLSSYRSVIIRFLLIPVLVYSVWMIETFLFEGHVQLFLHPDTAGIILYTAVTCILVGLIVPVILIRQAFITGHVNMHQLGFRSLRRTLLMVVLTAIIVWGGVVLQNPFGTDRTAFATAFLLLLPTGIASIMVCCVLIGTHVQSLVRDSGMLVSIPVGVIVTGIFFGLTSLVQFPGMATPDTHFRYITAGILVAIFFFAVRDVWAATIAVTGCLVWLSAGWLDTGLLNQSFSPIVLSSCIATGFLVVVHWHLSRHYVTIPVPAA